jgi:hypothetical protein
MAGVAERTEACAVCGTTLEYLVEASELTCSACGRTERGHVRCPDGHYLCEECHGASFLEQLDELLAQSADTSPTVLAERLMAHPDLPMLGCEHAHIAAGALMTALRNQPGLGITAIHVHEALQRTGRQAIGAYCGLSGVCGVVPALGACYSVLVGGQCGRGPETRAAMELVSRLAATTAAEAEPGCCKAYVRVCLAQTQAFLHERLGIALPPPQPATCTDMDRHPHGCRGPACGYHPESPTREEHAMSPLESSGGGPPTTSATTSPAAQATYDQFFALSYADGALDARTKILVALGASLAAGCSP